MRRGARRRVEFHALALVFALFVLTVAAAEIAVGLAVVVALFRRRGTLELDELREVRG